MKTQQAYNEWAHTYDSVQNKTRDLEMVAAQQVLADLDFSHVIEIGCGTGKNTAWLSKRAKALTAVDFSGKMLDVARAKLNKPTIDFVEADLTQPWHLSKSTLIVCSLVLEHIQDIDFIFQQAAEVLENNGHFYVCELHPYKQLQGTRARFESGEEVINIEYYIHHISDFYSAAANHQLNCIHLQEWFDNNDRSTTPRLVSFLFQKMVSGKNSTANI